MFFVCEYVKEEIRYGMQAMPGDWNITLTEFLKIPLGKTDPAL